jgi:hypothetical protein
MLMMMIPGAQKRNIVILVWHLPCMVSQVPASESFLRHAQSIQPQWRSHCSHHTSDLWFPLLVCCTNHCDADSSSLQSAWRSKLCPSMMIVVRMHPYLLCSRWQASSLSKLLDRYDSSGHFRPPLSLQYQIGSTNTPVCVQALGTTTLIPLPGLYK